MCLSIYESFKIVNGIKNMRLCLEIIHRELNKLFHVNYGKDVQQYSH